MERRCQLSFFIVVFLALYSPLCHAGSFFMKHERSLTSRFRRQAANDVVASADITDMFIKSTVRSRFATVQIDSHVVNREADSQEVSFTVQIPETSFLTNFTMEIDGKLLIAKVYEKKAAQEKYDEAKARGETAGQVRQQSQKPERGMDIFAIDVNVAGGSAVNFHLVYQEMIERKLGQYEQRISVHPGQVVNNLTLFATYYEPESIKSFQYMLPTSKVESTSSSDNVVVRAAPQYRELIYRPSAAEQVMNSSRNSSNGLVGELVIKYDVAHNKDGGTVVVKDNTFVHYFSPNGLEAMNKVILFVIDISGSMHGRKISQVRDAMHDILGRLRPSDYFNILLFDDKIMMWRNEPIISTKANIATAQEFVRDNVEARGSTNINDALLKGIAILRKSFALQGDKSRLLIFLTDGEPTAGETDTGLIRTGVREANAGKNISIFSLGFGFNLNFKFLKALSYENGGRAVRIYEERDAVEQLKNFYRQVENPLMTNVQMEYSGAVRVGEITQFSFDNYFQGSEIVVAGKTPEPITQDMMVAAVRGRSASGPISLSVTSSSVLLLSGEEGDFTMKLWAYLRIKDLLRKIAVTTNKMEMKRLEARALKLSLDYNFVTPLTSFAIVQADQQDGIVEDMVSNRKVFSSADVSAGRVSYSGISGKATSFGSCVTYVVTAALICLWFGKLD